VFLCYAVRYSTSFYFTEEEKVQILSRITLVGNHVIKAKCHNTVWGYVLEFVTVPSAFGEKERDPAMDLRLQFEALSQFDEEERKIVKALLESLILKHNAKRAFIDEIQQS